MGTLILYSINVFLYNGVNMSVNIYKQKSTLSAVISASQA